MTNDMHGPWSDWRKELNTIPVESFKNNDLIKSIPLHMPAWLHPFVAWMYQDMAHEEYVDLEEDNMGHTGQSWEESHMMAHFDVTGWTRVSVNKIRHYHFYRHIRDDLLSGKIERIVEFGAGAGELAKIIKHHHPDVEYNIFDFPEVIRFSSYINSNNDTKFHSSFGSIVNVSNKKTALLSSWGISESPLEMRRKFIEHVKPDMLFMTVQSEFEGIDNLRWVNGLSDNIVMSRIPRHNWDGGSYYVKVNF